MVLSNGLGGVLDRVVRRAAAGLPAPLESSTRIGGALVTMPRLDVRGVSKRFGGVQALESVDLAASPGEVHGLIGPNGAGKSTLVGCITGVNAIDAGEIVFGGRQIDALPVHARARLGIGRTFQKIRLAQEQTVFENVAVGLAASRLAGVAGYLGVLAPLSSRGIADIVRSALDEVGVADLAAERAGALPYGKRHLVELARALVARPSMLLLDEPATGLTDEDRQRLGALVGRLARSGCLIVLVEHDLALVGRICDRITVLDSGRRIFTGTPSEAERDAAVVKAYLGSATFASGRAS